MKTKFLTQLLGLVLICFGLTNCTDPYKLKTDTFEDALVVEATITNQMQKQTVKLSRTFRFEDLIPAFEENADVTVTDSDGNVYPFEQSNNVYTSVNEFQAVPGKLYHLTIITSDGKKYTSSKEVLPTDTPLQELTASVQTIDNIRGVEIKAKSYDPSSTSHYYRFEYEETYKIIAPKWRTFKPKVTRDAMDNPVIVYIPHTEETRTCYSTDKSTDILLLNTNETPEDRVDFPVRFISTQNYIMSHRYTILVHQYVQNLHAYNYYKALKKLSGSGSVLSPNQPGYLVGNIKSVNNPSEKVIGFFDVSSVSSKRLFFNYADLFPGEALPPYKVTCDEQAYKFCFNLLDRFCKGDQVLDHIKYRTKTIIGTNDDPIPIYIMTPMACAECTSFSSNIVPPFWE
ncbi:DUF4249 domain-containing protein [Flavobacterium cerinum]|uniref:DUF4249 domain-containing protein n=1 Tax=Flavobacterium cerinum TaxID=2502784 RepID=A0ABY5ISC2_9FLAO|nr:DUF4249 domain-containing protein [Flavobacterium cerinum]UUC45750.1 DUF4249 domain-containing protein [Flavobacterium cerinum]